MAGQDAYTEKEVPEKKAKVLFVCMGNICRSPSAEAVFHNMVQTSELAPFVQVASAGTHDYHVGQPADHRSHQHAARRGLDLGAHRAQHLQKEHFDEYDYIIVMDEANYRHAMKLCPDGRQDRVHYFMDFAPQLGVKEVPDPYHGGPEGFENVLDLIEAASAGLMSEIRDRYVDPPRLHREINAG